MHGFIALLIVSETKGMHSCHASYIGEPVDLFISLVLQARSTVDNDRLSIPSPAGPLNHRFDQRAFLSVANYRPARSAITLLRPVFFGVDNYRSARP